MQMQMHWDSTILSVIWFANEAGFMAPALASIRSSQIVGKSPWGTI